MGTSLVLSVALLSACGNAASSSSAVSADSSASTASANSVASTSSSAYASSTQEAAQTLPVDNSTLVDGIHIPNDAWRLPEIVPETEYDSNPATPKAAELRASLNIQPAMFKTFIHGEKPAEYQKYIMLHDTEEELEPSGVVGLWLGRNKQQIATHFVVGRDGSVVQCVPLDKIAHHAGYGNNGSNEVFGVPEDGRDDGGKNKDPKSKMNDYGINAYSVGIEMCHVGTDGMGYPVEMDYPEAQLKAVDRLIAYIDAYYGTESEIVDHKEWTEGNPDCSAEFDQYMVNYKTTRTHDGKPFEG